MRLPGLVLLAMAVAPSILALQEPGGGSPASSSFAGSWSGSGKFTAGDPSAPCQYTGAETPPAVVVDIQAKEGGLSGKIALDLAGASGSACAPIKARYRILDARVSGNSLAFTDAAGNEWSLTLREGRLQGLVSSPRLGGEVSLARQSEAQAAPPAGAGGAGPSAAGSPTKAPASPAPAVGGKPTAHGSAWGGIATVTAVTALGAGAFLGVNKALQDTKGGQAVAPTCSPRKCDYSGPGVCSCNVPLTTGISCGNTTAGVPLGGICNPPSLPCQSDFTCITASDGTTCRDTAFCPF
jgi:hypothetical protein